MGILPMRPTGILPVVLANCARAETALGLMGGTPMLRTGGTPVPRPEAAMKLNVNSPGYVLTFAAVVSTAFTGAIMTLHAVSERAAADAAMLYQQKSLVEVFDLGKDKPRPLGDEQVRELYRQSIHPYDKLLRDRQTGIVFNAPDPNAGPLAPRTFVALSGSGEVLGYALPITGIGFWARIDGYLAVTPDLSKVIGIVFLRHQETPGLGGRITEPRWREQFRGLDVAEPRGGGKYIYVGGDKPREKDNPRYGRHVDAITGATGTSTAVERFVNRDIDAFRRAVEQAGLIEKKNLNAESAESAEKKKETSSAVSALSARACRQAG